MNTQPAQPIPGDTSSPTNSHAACHDKLDCPEQAAIDRSTPPARPHRRTPRHCSTGSCAAPTASPTDWPTTCTPPDATTPNPRLGRLRREPTHRPGLTCGFGVCFALFWMAVHGSRWKSGTVAPL